MAAFTAILDTVAGAPTLVGLILTALAIFITSDWRLSLTALLVQYVLIGAALTSALQIEVVLVKVLVGVLVVLILYLTARRIPESLVRPGDRDSQSRLLDLPVRWAAGPLGLPLRLMTVLLIVLLILRVFGSYQLTIVPLDVAFLVAWLAAMGMAGLVLNSDPLRVAPALLTVLGGFDLVFARLKHSLPIAGFWGALMLLTALAFAYLAVVQEMEASAAEPGPPPDATWPTESSIQFESAPQPAAPGEAETGP